jgi:cytochrome c
MNNMQTSATVLGLVLSMQMGNTAMASEGALLYKERTCIACHGAEGKAPVMDEYPTLAGQNEVYLLKQMKDIKSGARNHAHTAPMKNIMHLVADEDMTVIAKWLSELK